MDRQYPWKRAEETEIDLTDLLRKLCRQWKQIAVCALASMVLLGGYGWLKGRNVLEADVSESAVEMSLTKEEEQKVADAVWLENEIQGLEAYFENSVLMKLDPYHKNKVIMLYYIDQAKMQELPVITESYLNFILNGGAADGLIKSGSWKMDKSCLSELIAAYQKTNSSFQFIMDSQSDSSDIMPGSFFYVEITGNNAKAADSMAQDMQDMLEDYSVHVKKNAGNHSLTLVNSAESVTSDSTLQSQQHDKKALLSSNKTALKSMTDAFSKKQMEIYNAAVGAENEEEELEKEVFENYLGMYAKYIVLGFAGGIFAYCGIFSCWYLFCDLVKSTEEMKRMYLVPVYGKIVLRRRNQNRFIDRTSKDDTEHGKAWVLNRIRLACQKQGIKRLYAASDFTLDAKEKECLESIISQLKEWNIDMEAVENVSTNPVIWDGITETGSVLMVCRMGLTTHRMIDDVMSFYMENGIDVIGLAAFSMDG